MEYQKLDGKLTSQKIKEEIAAEVKSIMQSGGKKPHLAAVWLEMTEQVKHMLHIKSKLVNK